MKKLTVRIAAFLFLMTLLPHTALAARQVIPVGRVVGLELKDGSVTVAGFDRNSPARDAGVREGDRFLKIDGKTVSDAAAIREALSHVKGKTELTLERSGKQFTLQVTPTLSEHGPQLGIFLREGITGIGTVTFRDPKNGTFAALGHGVNTARGQLLPMESGNIYSTTIVSVRKGTAGHPGQLVGSITTAEPIGSLRKNTVQGVFGSADSLPGHKALTVADRKDVREGKATILSNISGQTVQEYSVEILKVYPLSGASGRNMLIRITDPALLETTGGIVQGMSGSPIIQDGKLIGAVTHVLVNDPTMGYGIFIENMLDAAA